MGWQRYKANGFWGRRGEFLERADLAQYTSRTAPLPARLPGPAPARASQLPAVPHPLRVFLARLSCSGVGSP
jgi:hypothetical protein